MPQLAIVGSGPAGFYTAEAALKQWGEDAQIDVFDRLPVPYGLIRSGVAPDHQSIKAVARRYEATALADNVRFIGNVSVGAEVSVAELMTLYDAVILATGAPHDRALEIEGADLGNVLGSAAFVGWYNGHPEFAGLAPDVSGKHAVVINFMPAAFKICFHEYLHHFFSITFSYKPGRNTDDVCIIMFTGFLSNFFSPANGGTNALVFVGSNSHSIGATAKQNAKCCLSIFYGIGYRMSKIRIVNRVV